MHFSAVRGICLLLGRSAFIKLMAVSKIHSTWAMTDNLFVITRYLNYSVVTKDKSGYKDSQRIIAGAHFSAGPLFVYTEMRWGRNDPYTGDYVSGTTAGGEDKWKKAFYANIGYYF